MKVIISKDSISSIAEALAADETQGNLLLGDHEAYLDFDEPDVERLLRDAARELGRLYHCGYEHADLGNGWLGIRLETNMRNIARHTEQRIFNATFNKGDK